MDIDQVAYVHKVVEPGGVFRAEVDAPMTHRVAEVVVPVGAVQTVTLVEIHHIGHVWQVIARPAHGRVAVFDVYVVLACHRRMQPGAGRDHEGAHQIRAVVGIGGLGGEVDVHPMNPRFHRQGGRLIWGGQA